jgi:two-component sensor histidine kinase/ABC-type nitrate/sulfonate/bicarbonate transport system substrate-binding protein
MAPRRGLRRSKSARRLALLASLLLATHALSAEQALRVGLRSIYPAASAGFLIAEHLGFYTEAEIEIEFVSQESEGSEVVLAQDTLRSNRADLAIGGTEILVDSGGTTPLVAVFTVFQTSTARIFLKRNVSVPTIAELSRLPIILSAPGSRLWIETEAVLSINGIAIDDLTLVTPKPSDDPMQLVLSDAVVGFPGSMLGSEYVMNAFDISIVPVDPGSYGLDFYGETVFATQEFVDAHAEQVERFRQASRRGWEYVFTHPEETAEFLLATTEQPSIIPPSIVSIDFLLWQIAAIERLSGYPVVDVGYSSRTRWSSIATALEGLGLTDSSVVHDSFVFDYQAILARERRDTIVLILALSTSFVALIVIVALGRHVAVRSRNHREMDQLVEGLLHGVAYFREHRGLYALVRSNRVMRTMLADSPAGEPNETLSPEILLQQFGIAKTDARQAVSLMSVDQPPVMIDSITSGDGSRQYSVSLFATGRHTVGISVLDVTAQHNARVALEELVHQRTVTLREIHHRVRNNMQIVSSLMHLHATRVSSPETLHYQAIMQNQIRALSIAHEMLYDDFSSQLISAEAYVDHVGSNAFRYLQQTSEYALRYEMISDGEMGAALIDLDTAVPIGLVVTTAITNAGYCVPADRPGDASPPLAIRVSCELGTDRSICVAIAADGSGYARDTNADDLSMQIMELLAAQLNGYLSVETTPGHCTELRLIVPATNVTIQESGSVE